MVKSSKAGWDLHALGDPSQLLMNNCNECQIQKNVPKCSKKLKRKPEFILQQFKIKPTKNT